MSARRPGWAPYCRVCRRASRPPSARAAGERYLFLLNHGAEAVEVGLPSPMRDVLAGAHEAAGAGVGAGAGPIDRITLGPRGVAVLTEP